MIFRGSVQDLKSKFLFLDGEWREVARNSNQIQFRHANGGIMNFYKSTGTPQFQGNEAGRQQLQAMVAGLLGETEVVQSELFN